LKLETGNLKLDKQSNPYHKARPLKNLKAFDTLRKRMGFSEVTGGRALSFCDVSMGETAGLPLDRAEAMRRGQNSHVDTLLKRPAWEPWN